MTSDTFFLLLLQLILLANAAPVASDTHCMEIAMANYMYRPVRQVAKALSM